MMKHNVIWSYTGNNVLEFDRTYEFTLVYHPNGDRNKPLTATKWEADKLYATAIYDTIWTDVIPGPGRYSEPPEMLQTYKKATYSGDIPAWAKGKTDRYLSLAYLIDWRWRDDFNTMVSRLLPDNFEVTSLSKVKAYYLGDYNGSLMTLEKSAYVPFPDGVELYTRITSVQGLDLVASKVTISSGAGAFSDAPMNYPWNCLAAGIWSYSPEYGIRYAGYGSGLLFDANKHPYMARDPETNYSFGLSRSVFLSAEMLEIVTIRPWTFSTDIVAADATNAGKELPYAIEKAVLGQVRSNGSPYANPFTIRITHDLTGYTQEYTYQNAGGYFIKSVPWDRDGDFTVELIINGEVREKRNVLFGSAPLLKELYFDLTWRPSAAIAIASQSDRLSGALQPDRLSDPYGHLAIANVAENGKVRFAWRQKPGDSFTVQDTYIPADDVDIIREPTGRLRLAVTQNNEVTEYIGSDAHGTSWS